MPYINERDRSKASLSTEGDLNYRIHELIEIFLNGQEKVGYAQYNAVVGVLECAKQEFYRRAVSTYEDAKLVENGDISLYNKGDE